ncbi:MAG: O-antigen ligase family protein, partial [Candidatus Binatia bacterium]
MSRRRDSWIEGALYALIAGLFFSPWLRDVAAVLLAALLVTEARAEPSRGNGGRRNLAVAFFLVIHLLSAIFGARPAAALASLRFYPLGVLLFLGARRLTEAGRAERLALVLALVVWVLASDVLGQVVSGGSLLRGLSPVSGRFMGSLAHPTDVSALPILLPLALAALRAMAWGRLLALVTVVLTGLAAAASGTRAAWLGLGIAVFASGWVHERAKLSAAMAVLVFFLTIVVTLPQRGTAAPQRLVSAESYARDPRLLQWRAAWALFLEAPVLGHAPHSFREACAEHAGAAPGSIFARIDLRAAPYPHNLYLEALAGTGAMGLGAFLLLLAGPFRARRGAGPGSLVRRSAAASTATFALVGLVDMSLLKDWVHL